MISELKIGNFKAFGPAQAIPLRPITLVFGPNSAGKSSVIQSLLLARHVQETGRWDAFQTKLGGSGVDLGGFRQYIHKHECDQRELTLSFAIGSDGVAYKVRLQPTGGHDAARAVPRVNEIQIFVGGEEVAAFKQTEKTQFVIERISSEHPLVVRVIKWGAKAATVYGLSELIDGPSESLSAELQKIETESFGQLRAVWKNAEITVSSTKLEQPNRLSTYYTESDSMEAPDEGDEPFIQIRDVLASDDPRGFARRCWKAQSDAEAVAFWVRKHIEDLTESVSRRVNDCLASVAYLGPLRSFPARYFLSAGEDDPDWMAGGGWAWEAIRTRPEVLEGVNRLLETTFTIPYRLELRSLVNRVDDAAILRAVRDALADERNAGGQTETMVVAEQTDLAERRLADTITRKLHAAAGGEVLAGLVLIDQRNGTDVSHRDVGIGISQVLPVLVSALASKNSLITMEQPELHLHPALQAELGDVFIDSALGKNQNRFLIETHSEHLLLRIMRRMRETARGNLPAGAHPLTPDHVALLYVSPDSQGSVVQDIGLNERGELVKGWPGGFFEEGLTELFS